MAVRFRCPDARMADHPYPDGPLEVELSVESDTRRRIDELGVTLSDRYGTRLINADTVALSEPVWLNQGRTDFLVRIDELHLNPDTYTLGLWLANPNLVFDSVSDAAEIEVVDRPAEVFGKRPQNDGKVSCSFSIRMNI